MKQNGSSRSIGALLGAAALTAIGITAMAAPGAQQGGGGAAAAQQIGDFRIENTAVLQASQNPKTGALAVTLTGKPRVTAVSARYDMIAAKIVLGVAKGKVTSGNASGAGGVDVRLRDPQKKVDSTLHANTANYVSATTGRSARLHLVGNVRWVYSSPDWEKPIITTGDTADVVLKPDGGNDVTLTNPTIVGTPKEPTPKPKVKP